MVDTWEVSCSFRVQPAIFAPFSSPESQCTHTKTTISYVYHGVWDTVAMTAPDRYYCLFEPGLLDNTYWG